MAEEEKQRSIMAEAQNDDDNDEGGEGEESDTETDGDDFGADESEPDNSGNPSSSKIAADSESAVKPKPETPSCSSPQLNAPNRNLNSGSESRRLFQRLWTDEEEIRILGGFLEFTRRRGTTFASHQYDTGPFYEEIKRQLQLDFSKNQLVEKLRRLKKKYRNCVARMRSKGANFSYRSPHERAIYDIARHIWRPANKRDRPLTPDDPASFSFSLLPPPPAAADADVPDSSNRSRRRARRRIAPPLQPLPVAALPISIAVSSYQEVPLPDPVPVSISVPAPLPPTPLPAQVPLPFPSSEEVLRSCLSPLFKELIGSATAAGTFGHFGLGPIPVCPPGKSGDEKWRKQHILELEVYLKRLYLLKDQVIQALHELKDSTS